MLYFLLYWQSIYLAFILLDNETRPRILYRYRKRDEGSSSVVPPPPFVIVNTE